MSRRPATLAILVVLVAPIAGYADQPPIVVHPMPPYPPLRAIRPSHHSAFTSCMTEQRRQGFYDSKAWAQARAHCAHRR